MRQLSAKENPYRGNSFPRSGLPTHTLAHGGFKKDALSSAHFLRKVTELSANFTVATYARAALQ